MLEHQSTWHRFCEWKLQIKHRISPSTVASVEFNVFTHHVGFSSLVICHWHEHATQVCSYSSLHITANQGPCISLQNNDFFALQTMQMIWCSVMQPFPSVILRTVHKTTSALKSCSSICVVKMNNIYGWEGLHLLFIPPFLQCESCVKPRGSAGSQSQVRWQTQVFPSPCICEKEVFRQPEGM